MFAHEKMKALILWVVCALTIPRLTTAAIIREFFCVAKQEILSEQPKCTNLVVFFESSLGISDTCSGTTEEKPLETYFVSESLKTTASGMSDPLEWPTKYHHPCSIFLYSILSLANVSDNTSLNYDNWPKPPKAESDDTSYHIFILPWASNEPKHLPDFLHDFARTTRKTLHGFFSVIHTNSLSVQTYALSSMGDQLILISTFESNCPTYPQKGILQKPDPNFHRALLVANMCAICGKEGLEHFKKTGVWVDHLVGTMYELTLQVNASLETEPIFGQSRTGLTAEGEWDEYVQPTFDGSATFVMLLEPSIENRKVIYVTKPIFDDNVCFMTHRPKRLRLNRLSRLTQPLKSTVWMAIAESLICLFIAIEVTVAVQRHLKFEHFASAANRSRSQLPKIQRALLWSIVPEHFSTWTITALVKSALDQNGLSNPTFSQNVEGTIARLLLTLWYLMLIVVGCGYKSNLTSMIVKPVYLQPPQTFSELAASNYEIGSVFYSGNLDASFAAFNNSMSREIQARVVEHDFLEPHCYTNIFKRDAVCIGSLKFLYALSARFAMDIYGRVLYQFSKERLFPLLLGLGLSKQYPMLLVPLNNLISFLDCSGILGHWIGNNRVKVEAEGKHSARMNLRNDKMYSGEETEGNEFEVYSKIVFFMEILFIGHFTAFLAFIWEIIWMSYHMRGPNRDERRELLEVCRRLPMNLIRKAFLIGRKYGRRYDCLNLIRH